VEPEVYDSVKNGGKLGGVTGKDIKPAFNTGLYL